MFLIACWIILWWQLETFVGSFWHPCHLSVLHWLSFLIQAEVFLVLGMTSEFESLGQCILRLWMLSKFYVLEGLFWQRQMGCSSIPADGSGSSSSWLSFCWCLGKGLLITAGWREFWPPVVCTDTTLTERGRVPHYCFLHGLAPPCGAKEEDLITPQLWLISCLSTRPHRRPQWRGQGMPCYHLLCSLHVRLPTGTAGVMPPPLLAGMKVLLSCCPTQPSGHHFDAGFGWGWKSRCSVHLCWCGWGGDTVHDVWLNECCCLKGFCFALLPLLCLLCRESRLCCFFCLFGPFALSRLSAFSAPSKCSPGLLYQSVINWVTYWLIGFYILGDRRPKIWSALYI